MTNVLVVAWVDNDFRLYVNGTPRKAKDIAKEWDMLYGEKDKESSLVICALALSAVAWAVAVAFALGSLILYWRG